MRKMFRYCVNSGWQKQLKWMNFWGKLFGKNESAKMDSYHDKYIAELRAADLTSFEDLENLVKPLVKPAIKINVEKASRPPENSQLNSHFGGQPFFEQGEKWPMSNNEKPLQFIFQIYNREGLELPDTIELVQFYYSSEEYPWETDQDGWLVKIYKKINKNNIALIERPTGLEQSKYCEVTFNSVPSLPHWEGLSSHGDAAFKLSCVLNEKEPWANYDEVVNKLVGEQEYQSQLAGYPMWVQGESTPNDSKGNPMKLLFQIDSEDNAGLMWGDAGLVYVFYEEETGRIEFTLQCH
jgi:uncharacterized protein YwqG